MAKPKLKRKDRQVPQKKQALVRREPPTLAEAVEKVLISGDLSPLNVDQRLVYYRAVCKSLGLNPLTRPFDYIVFFEGNGAPGKLALYARKDCAEQLRRMYGIGVVSLKREISEDLCCAEAHVRDKLGKEDFATGVVSLYKIKDGKRFKLEGKELCNAIMKAETKAKRRATLSICGLGMLDESEIETLEHYAMVTPGGRVIQEAGTFGTVEAAQAVARRQIEDHKGGKPLEAHPDEPIQEIISAVPWKEGRLALSGNGLNVLKSELDPEALADLGIVVSARDRVTHMPEAKWFTLQDRAAKCGVIATLERGSTDATDNQERI